MLWEILKQLKLIERIKGCVELDLCGLNIERTLNCLCKQKVEFYYVEKKDIKNVKIKIKNKYLKIILKTLNENNIEITNIKYAGIYKINNLLKNRKGLILGLIFCLILLIIFNNFLFNIKVFGNENVKTEDIVFKLSENGVNTLTHMNNISTEQIEKIILENFEDVGMVSAVKKGTSIVINIKEKLKHEEQHDGFNNLTPVLSTQNGMITKIELISGTPLVKVGDIVKVGDPLVAPYVVNSVGQQIPIVAKANVYADVWLTGTAEHHEVVNRTERTGNKQTFRETSLFNIPIFTNTRECEFKNYEIEVKESYLSTTILPIKYKEIFYFETKCVIIEQKFEEVKSSVIENAKQNALLQIKETDVILKEDYSISENNGKFVVEYVITTNKNIAI